MNWFDKEVDFLEESLYQGEITYAEFKKEMSLLKEELQACAEEAAEEAYKEAYNDSFGW